MALASLQLKVIQLSILRAKIKASRRIFNHSTLSSYISFLIDLVDAKVLSLLGVARDQEASQRVSSYDNYLHFQLEFDSDILIS